MTMAVMTRPEFRSAFGRNGQVGQDLPPDAPLVLVELPVPLIDVRHQDSLASKRRHRIPVHPMGGPEHEKGFVESLLAKAAIREDG